jgi:hypothetical protein
VSEIISEYWEHLTDKEPQVKAALDGMHYHHAFHAMYTQFVFAGLRLLFDEEVGTRLLYRFERVQLRRMLKQNPSARLSDLYGAEHLLRLFGTHPHPLPLILSRPLKTRFAAVHMSQNMSQVDFTDGETDTIKTAISGLMRFLAGNVHTFFLTEYEQPPQEYVKETGLQ